MRSNNQLVIVSMVISSVLLLESNKRVCGGITPEHVGMVYDVAFLCYGNGLRWHGDFLRRKLSLAISVKGLSYVD
jgi:hypothetical protein